jgi:hypothetical protein
MHGLCGATLLLVQADGVPAWLAYVSNVSATAFCASCHHGKWWVVALAEDGRLQLLLQHEGDNGVVWVLCRQITH